MNNSIINRWVLAKSAVKLQLSRLQAEADEFTVEFVAKTGQKLVSAYQPLLPSERTGEWVAAAKGRPQLYVSGERVMVSFIAGNNGNYQFELDGHWEISLGQAERLAIELAGLSDASFTAMLETFAGYTG